MQWLDAGQFKRKHTQAQHKKVQCFQNRIQVGQFGKHPSQTQNTHQSNETQPFPS